MTQPNKIEQNRQENSLNRTCRNLDIDRIISTKLSCEHLSRWIGSQLSYSNPWKYLRGFLVFRLERMPNAFESDPRSRASSFARVVARDHRNAGLHRCLMFPILVMWIGNAHHILPLLSKSFVQLGYMEKSNVIQLKFSSAVFYSFFFCKTRFRLIFVTLRIN